VLDTTVCSGFATGFGVFVVRNAYTVSLLGDKMSNMGSSLLKAVGLYDLVTESLDEYKRIAIELNHNEERYIEIIGKLEEKRLISDLFDTSKWVQNFDLGLKQAHTTFNEGNKPSHIHCKKVERDLIYLMDG